VRQHYQHWNQWSQRICQHLWCWLWDACESVYICPHIQKLWITPVPYHPLMKFTWSICTTYINHNSSVNCVYDSF
jgi:hypothetical protein